MKTTAPSPPSEWFKTSFLAHLSLAQDEQKWSLFCLLSVYLLTLSNDNSSKAIEVICL